MTRQASVIGWQEFEIAWRQLICVRDPAKVDADGWQSTLGVQVGNLWSLVGVEGLDHRAAGQVVDKVGDGGGELLHSHSCVRHCGAELVVHSGADDANMLLLGCRNERQDLSVFLVCADSLCTCA